MRGDDVDRRPPASFAAFAGEARAGRCFEIAENIVRCEGDGWLLVIGTVQGGMKHAWVQHDGAVFSPVLGEWFAAADYAARFDAHVERIFSYPEVMSAWVHFGGRCADWSTQYAAGADDR